MTAHELGEDPQPKQITHPQLVAALTKPGADILRSLTPEKCNLLHLASCVAPEGGELFDAIKKHVFYEGELNRANVIEECGDIAFYLQGIYQALGITHEEVLAANIAKLRARYEKKTGVLGYTNAAAHERLDKADRVGFQVTHESARNKAKWPDWMIEAWNRPHIQAGALGYYCLDDSTMGARLAVKMDDARPGHPVEWGQWIVREPWGAISIETNFQPGK